jgi:hypothetical protein
MRVPMRVNCACARHRTMAAVVANAPPAWCFGSRWTGTPSGQPMTLLVLEDLRINRSLTNFWFNTLVMA